jgi:hypothetical protein
MFKRFVIQKKGLSIGWILGAGALVGAAVGLGLSFKKQRAIDRELARLEASGNSTGAVSSPPRKVMTLERAVHDPMAADPESLRGLPPYPGASPRRLSTAPTAQGSDMAISWFTTTDTPATVLRYYDEAFAPHGALRTSYRYSENAGYSAFYEPPSEDAGTSFVGGVMHLVGAMKQGSKTLIMVSASRPSEMLAAASKLPDGVKLPPGTKRPQWLSVGEGEVQKKVVYATIEKTDLAAIEAFYKTSLEGEGWSVEASSGGDQHLSLAARKGGANLTIAADARGAGARLLVTVDQGMPPRTGVVK